MGKPTERPAANEERRRLILAHPDLAERLRKLYGMKSADQWWGYIPGPLTELNQPNRSHYREELLKLLAEAKRREEQAK